MEKKTVELVGGSRSEEEWPRSSPLIGTGAAEGDRTTTQPSPASASAPGDRNPHLREHCGICFFVLPMGRSRGQGMGEHRWIDGSGPGGTSLTFID